MGDGAKGRRGMGECDGRFEFGCSGLSIQISYYSEKNSDEFD